MHGISGSAGVPGGYQPYRKISFGYPDKGPYGRISRAAPGIRVIYEDSGGVLYVGCPDLASAGNPSALAFCTNLSIPGVPADGLSAFMDSASAGTWDRIQPFDTVSLDYLDFQGTQPQSGPARLFGISGPGTPGPTATNSSGL